MKQFYDILNDLVHVEFADGKRFSAPGRDVREYGLAELLRRNGASIPTGRIPVKQGGRLIGSVSAYFTPMLSKSNSYFYQPRPHDFTHKGDHWEAHNSLGPGDLDAIPGFRWDDAEYERGKARRHEEERGFLREALFDRADHTKQGG